MIYTLVPLGNPGRDYEATRHNAGRIVLSMIEEGIQKISSCEVFVPELFMNESGRAITDYLRYHDGRELVIVYDDKDLAFGTFRISHDRGDGGHNGLKSIISSLGTKEFIRVRIGIAPHDTDGTIVKPPHGEMVQDYVLGRITDDEMVSLRTIAPHVLGAIRTIVEEGYTKAMERYNSKQI